MGEPLALASISAAELLAGIHRADTAERRERREAFVERILEAVPAFPFDVTVARVYADLAENLRASGTTIGTHDLMIAATALAHGYEVLTENVRHFDRVPGLVVHQPDW